MCTSRVLLESTLHAPLIATASIPDYTFSVVMENSNLHTSKPCVLLSVPAAAEANPMIPTQLSSLKVTHGDQQLRAENRFRRHSNLAHNHITKFNPRRPDQIRPNRGRHASEVETTVTSHVSR